MSSQTPPSRDSTIPATPEYWPESLALPSSVSPSPNSVADAAAETAIWVYHASDGTPLSFRFWPAVGIPARGAIVFLHGIQSHSGWYVRSGQFLANCGFHVLMPDRRGSGLNAEQRGHTPSFRRSISDTCAMLSLARIVAGGQPVYLSGLSWGAKLATATALVRPDLIQGLWLLYPGLVSRFQPDFFRRTLLRLAATGGKGDLLIPIPLSDPKLFTRIPQWQEFIANDPLALKHATVRFLCESLQLDRFLRQHARTLAGPVLLATAGRDQIVDNPRTEKLLSDCLNIQLRHHHYPTAEHTIEFDPAIDQLQADLAGWLTHVG